jgi:hypothetical protein
MADRPFKLLLESKLGAPVAPQWHKWGQCAAELHRKVPLDAYAVVQSSSGASFLIFTPQTTGAAARNCHGHTGRFLPSFSELAKTYGGVLGIHFCGSNPQKIILETATQLIADKLPQDPATLSKTLDKMSPKAGDVLVWVDRNTGDLVHSTTIIGRVDGDWLVNDKMNDRPERKTWVTTVADALYRPATPKHPGEEEEGEFHPEREPTVYEVQLRRPK